MVVKEGMNGRKERRGAHTHTLTPHTFTSYHTYTHTTHSPWAANKIGMHTCKEQKKTETKSKRKKKKKKKNKKLHHKQNQKQCECKLSSLKWKR
jgi:hypothetical protein